MKARRFANMHPAQHPGDFLDAPIAFKRRHCTEDLATTLRFRDIPLPVGTRRDLR